MKKNSKHSSVVDVDDFFASAPTPNQKAWGLVHDFYHLVLTYMEQNKISRAELATRLGKSRSSITQLFNKTPNISVKRMAEIADAIGLEISITSKQMRNQWPVQTSDAYVKFMQTCSLGNWTLAQPKEAKELHDELYSFSRTPLSNKMPTNTDGYKSYPLQ